MPAGTPPEEDRTLPLQPPRRYRLREAYTGRVWRNPGALLARDALLLGVATALWGVLYDDFDFVILGGFFAVLMILLQQLSLLRANLRRVALLRDAPAVKGRIGRPKRVLLLSELFKGEKERTFTLPYVFDGPEGEVVGQVWVCGCVRPFIPEGSSEWIAYHPERPRHSLPLRLAVMRAPH